MKKLITLFTIIAAFTLQSTAQQPPEKAPGTLYERLGGAEGIAVIVNEVVDAHLVNPVIKERFLPFEGTPGMEMAKKHLTDFFISGSGGPAQYTGRDMQTTHKGMQISHKEYMAAIDDAMMVLAKHNIDEETKKDVLAIFWSLKDMIIGQ